MRTFHTGGVAGEDITQGLPRVQEIFEARVPKGKAPIAETAGRVRIEEGDRSRKIIIVPDDGSDEIVHDKLSKRVRLRIQDGGHVEVGEKLTEGTIDPHELLRIMGPRAVQVHLTQEVQEVYRSQGVLIHDKHIEIIIRQMLKRVTVIDSGAAEFLPGVRVPVVPFCGEVGVAPPTGPLSTIPPDVFGGNMDTRHLTAGSTLFLPVFHDGGRLSMGDGHAAQGDGEVCGTAIETPMRALVRLVVRKDIHVTGPEFLTADIPPVAAGRRYATDGVGPDLLQAARDAVHRMMDWLGREHGIAPIDAYLLTSVAIDLRISEIVDMPNFVVTAHCPLSIFD